MNFLSTYKDVLFFIVIFFIVHRLFILFLPQIKGKFGEWIIKKHVQQNLNDKYILLNDITLPDGDGTTQIDHILLSPYGIFVIETKNYKGWIFGREKQRIWTQQISYNRKYKFQNPIHQNYKHIKVLEAIFSEVIPSSYLHSIVVFMPNCEFKTEMPLNVFKGKEWLNYVGNFREEVISAIQLNRAHLHIYKSALDRSWKTNQQHINYLKYKI